MPIMARLILMRVDFGRCFIAETVQCKFNSCFLEREKNATWRRWYFDFSISRATRLQVGFPLRYVLFVQVLPPTDLPSIGLKVLSDTEAAALELILVLGPERPKD